jgi:acyl-CoA dehydrogenase
MTATAWSPPTERLEQVRAIMHDRVLPNEAALDREDDAADALVAELRDEVKRAGLWAPHVPPDAGGTGTGFLDYAYLNEQIGRTLWGQLVFGCQAPDAGNAEILHMFGTDEQKERWLFPLVAGDIRSFFSMTEPEVPGSDPTTLRTRAVRDADHRPGRRAGRGGRTRHPDDGPPRPQLVDAL